MGESDKNRKKVKNRTFQTKYHYGLIHIVNILLYMVVVYVGGLARSPLLAKIEEPIIIQINKCQNRFQHAILLKCSKFQPNKTNIGRDIAILSLTTPGPYI